MAGSFHYGQLRAIDRQGHGKDDDYPVDDLLVLRRRADHVDADPQQRDDQDADQRPAKAADAAGYRRAADDDGGDRRQKQRVCRVRGGRR